MQCFYFHGNHHYVWDKKQNLVQVKWDDTKVIYNNQTLEGAYRMSKPLTRKLIKQRRLKANDYLIMIPSGLLRL
jgi:hypothetical protein